MNFARGRATKSQDRLADCLRSELPLAFDVACEVVEDRLPSAALLLSRVSGVVVEGHPDADTGRVRSKHDVPPAGAE